MSYPITIPESDKELLKECKIDTFRSKGKGGQHINKIESAVRISHMPSGVIVTCQDERSQYQNKRKCLIQLRKKLEIYNYRTPKRIPTKFPKSARKKLLESKKKHSIKKQLRKKPEIDY